MIVFLQSLTYCYLTVCIVVLYTNDEYSTSILIKCFEYFVQLTVGSQMSYTSKSAIEYNDIEYLVPFIKYYIHV